jgi:WD40 repeat protein
MIVRVDSSPSPLPVHHSLLSVSYDPLRKIVIEFLENFDFACVSSTCRYFYNQLNDTAAGKESLWSQRFARDFPELTAAATKILDTKTCQRHKVRSQFYRVFAGLSPKCTSKSPDEQGSVCSLVPLSNGTLVKAIKGFYSTPSYYSQKDRVCQVFGDRLPLAETSIRQILRHPRHIWPITLHEDSKIRLWHMPGDHLEPIDLKVNPDPTDKFLSITLAPGGALVTGSEKGRLTCWTLKGDRLGELPKCDWPVTCLISLTDGFAAASEYSNTIYQWITGRNYVLKGRITGRKYVLKGHFAGVTCLLELSNGTLASGSFDTRIRLWSKHTEQSLRGHTSAVVSLAKLTGGFWVSGSWDGTVRLWGPKGSPITVIPFEKFYRSHWDRPNLFGPQPTVSVTCVGALTAGGFAAGSRDGNIAYWQYDASELVNQAIKRTETDPCVLL